jgi:DegV family protein with EDD domain
MTPRDSEGYAGPPMASVAVVTDSTAYLPTELADEHGIHVVPLYIVFGGDRTVPETEITDYGAFFEELRRAGSPPTTSQPSVGDFVSAYEPLLAQGRDVLSIHISSGLSGTSEAARQAAHSLQRDGKGGERVRVVDSTSAAGGLGLLVLGAARAATAGAQLDEVEQRVTEARRELKMWFGIDTLEFLKRGGRIGAASAWIGSTLKVKPILTVENEMTPVERVRTSRRMFERMVDYARQRHESGADAWAVQHISAPEDADRLAERCRGVFGREAALFSEIGPVLSAHTGPGLLGVGSIPPRFLD